MQVETYSAYDPGITGLAESALLTLWPNLGPWHDDLVLVGGLVPRYICGDAASRRALPQPVTLDADLGIALGASAGGMSSLRLALLEQGFRQAKTQEGATRYVKQMGHYSVPVDFLTDYPPNTHGVAQVDDITASILPGIDRALRTARVAVVTGTDLSGKPQTATMRVCEAGPFLVMKLRAFLWRQEGKDAFDLLYTLDYYDQGTAVAIAAFEQEIRAGNAACPDALRCLAQHFVSEHSLGPTKLAHFFPGAAVPNDPPDLRFQRLQIQQEMVNAARMLIKAALPASALSPTPSSA